MNAPRPSRRLPGAIRRKVVVAGVAGVVAMMVGGCGSSSDSGSGSSQKDPIVIGMSLPLTGPVADRAKPGYEGYQYWVDEINAKGGMLGRNVELKVLDDGFDQKTAISDYTKLIGQDKVDLVLGTFSSDLNLAVAPIAERYNYVYVEPSGGADEIFERGFKKLFFAQPATTQKLPDQFVRMIEAAPEDQRPKTVAYVTVEDPNTTQLEKILKEDLEALGLKTVHSATYAADASNFDAIANAVKQAKPDLVVSGSIAQDGIQLIRSFQKLGFSPDMLYQTNTPTDPAFADGIGKDSTEGILTYLAYSAEANYSGNDEFVSGYEKKFGAPPSEDAANSYTAGQVLAAGVKGAGSLDQDAIADWLHANSVDTIVGPLSWNDAGASQGDMLLAQFQGGELRVIGPSRAATAKDIIYKKPGW
jgi:branched-chain amino acid transport system substrate-binding protein